jgi:hypothetical protein
VLPLLYPVMIHVQGDPEFPQVICLMKSRHRCAKAACLTMQSNGLLSFVSVWHGYATLSQNRSQNRIGTRKRGPRYTIGEGRPYMYFCMFEVCDLP